MLTLDPLMPDDRLQDGLRWIEVGNALRAKPGSSLSELLEAYGKAAALIAPLCDSETSPIRDDLASAWINRGIALIQVGSAEALNHAIDSFNKAIELRTTLLGLDHPWFRYNLIGVWINRGDALAALGDPASRAAAVASYEEAIRLAAGMKLDPRPKVSWRLALAHLNRGATLLLMPEGGNLGEAGRSFDSAIALLGSSTDSQRLIAAYAWEGKAEVLGHQGADAEARACARRAMGLVSGLEPGGLDAMVVGLKARIALCAHSWNALASPSDSEGDSADGLEALDAADEGLRLAFASTDPGQLEPLIRELFRFGSLGYAALQPKFLGEFVNDFALAPSHPGLRAALRPLAVHAVRNAIGRLAADGILRAGLSPREIATFGSLRNTLEQLEQATAPSRLVSTS